MSDNASKNSDIYYQSTAKFILLFDITNYEDFMPYNDSRVGFTVKRKYPDNIRFKPPLRKDGKPDVVALLHVYYTHPLETEDEVKPSKVPLVISVSPYSLYKAHHFEYDHRDIECPTKVSLERSKKTPQPIPLEFHEYYFHHGKNTFFKTPSGYVLTGRQLLDEVFQRHLDTAHLVKSLLLRIKIWMRDSVITVLDSMIKITKWLLNKLFGRTLESKEIFAGHLSVYTKEDLVMIPNNSLTFMNYTTSKNSIMTFCIIIICVYSAFYFSSIKFFKDTVAHTFIATVMGLLFLFIIDSCGPLLFFHITNMFIRLRRKMTFWGFKF